MKTPTQHAYRMAGFSMMEMVVALAIMGTVVAIATPLAIDKIEASKIVRAKKDVQTLRSAVSNFKLDTRRYPMHKVLGQTDAVCPNMNCWFILESNANGVRPGYLSLTIWPSGWESYTGPLLHHLIDNTTMSYYADATADEVGTGWRGPYLDNNPIDPWGRRYILYMGGFSQTTRTTWAISSGRDGMLSTRVESGLAEGQSLQLDDIGVRM